MKDLLIEARNKIDTIDKEMAKLFVERLKASEMVAKYKQEHGLKILDPIREAEVIKRNSEAVEEDVYREYYVNFQKHTMSLSRAYQARLLEGMKVAYAGTEGAYAHLAAMKLFPTSQAVACGSFDEAYAAVENGECDIAVLPIENSYNGDVGQVSDLMFSGPLYVNTVTELAISHDLLAPKGTKLEDITTVISHPQALGQCHGYIVNKGYSEIEFANTALAAKYVADNGDGKTAAIASREAANIFGLEVLATNINESSSNTTRFAVFSRSENKNSTTDKRVHTILLFTVRHEAGALAQALEIIAKYGFNMGALRSRPMKELLWHYYFYIEAEGNLDSEDGKKMLSELKQYCDRLKTVGSYTVV